jgi:hypothetical protein
MFGPPLPRLAVARRLAVVTAAGVCAAGALTGCGSGGHTSAHASSSATATGDQAAAARELVQCFRQHGVPTFPDLVFDQQSHSWQIPSGTRKPPPSTMSACRSAADKLRQGSKDDDRPLTAAEVANLRRLSQCMRQHGVPDWPDPNADGTMPLPPRLRSGGKTLVRSQLQACRQYFPANVGIRVSGG